MGKKEIDLYEKVSIIYADLAVLKEKNDNFENKINDIHKTLIGNGKPGLVDEFNSHKIEFNKWKGIVRGISITFGILIAGIPFIISLKDLF